MTRYSLRMLLSAALLSLGLLNQSSEAQATNPVVITGLTVSSKTPSSVSLSWNANGNNSNFIVRWSKSGVNTSSNMNNKSYTVTGLSAGVNYTFTVSVENQTTGEDQISAFTNPAVVNNLTAPNKTTSSVSLTWNGTNGTRSHFIVNWTDGGASKGNSTTLDTSYTVTDLTAGVNYMFTVTAVAADNQTAGAPTQISVFTVPTVVSNFTASTLNQTTSSVYLTWNEPTGSRSFFEVLWTNGSDNFSNKTYNTFYTVTGLIAGTIYTFTVTAVAADGNSTGAPTQIKAFTRPGVVANLLVSNKTTSFVSLNWNEPNGTRNHFTVNWIGGSVNNSSNTSNTFYTITDLTAGMNYTFTVTAVAADNLTTGAPTQISAFTKPNSVTNLTAPYKTTSSVSLTWSEPIGKKNHFIVKWTDASGNFNSTSTMTSYTVTALTAGVSYTFTVTAVAADNQTEGAPTQIIAFTQPNPITSLTVSNKNTSSVSLTWNKPQGNWSVFTVHWTGGSGNNSVNNRSNTSSTSYTVTDLTAGVSYTFTVTAVAADNQTEGAPTQIIAFTQPNPITSLTVSNKNTSSVSLTWNKPQGNWSVFTVHWTGGSGNNSVNNRSNTSSTSYTVTDLTAGVSYTFTVTAVAADNQTEGAPTQIIAFTQPNPITSLTVPNKNTSSVSLTWNKPQGNWSVFTVHWTGGSGNNSVNNRSNTSSTSYTVTDLTAGVSYTFTVTAVAADNQTEGAPTQIIAFTQPNPITSLTVSNKNTSSVSLTWNKPQGNWSVFTVHWTGGSGNNSVNNRSNTSSTSYTVTDLTAGVSYTFTVTAVAADNQTEGAPTQIIAFTQPNPITSLTVSNKNTSSVSLTWNKPQGNWSVFTVHWTGGSGNNSVNNRSNTSSTSYTVTDLTAGVSYTFTVTAVAADNQTEGAPTQIIAFTQPNPITSLTVPNKNTSSVSLTWNKPQGNWSVFTVHWTGGSGNNSVNNRSNTSSTSYTVTDLTAGVSYTFTVTAVAADNQTEGAPTQIIAFTQPNPITSLTVPNKNTSSVSLTWNKPQGNWSVFTVHWTGGSGNNSSNTSITSYNVTGLTAGVNYTFTVTAVAEDGQTKGAPTQTSAFTNPDVVGNLAVSRKNTSSVSLTWNETHEDWSFKLEWTNGSTLYSIIITNTSYTITDLTAGVNYSFAVTAVAADNLTTGAPTQISTFTKPDTVSYLTAVNVTTASILLYWTEAMGEISYYLIQYENFNMAVNKTTENSSINITNLNPGVQYTFKVFTVAADNITEGNYSCTSAYTKPNTVSNLTAFNVTTTSILLYWTEAMGEISNYVIYEHFNMTVNKTTENTRINITNLTSGVQYTFKVFAVAADNKTEGNYSCISAYTKPDTIGNLKSSGISTTTIFLDWNEPLGKWSFFKVLRMNDKQWTTSATAFNFTDLESGTNYTFAVSAVAADNKTESSLVGLSTCTGASPVLDIICEGPNRTAAALLNLTWTNPPGNNQGFNISLNQTTSVFVPRCDNVCSYNFSKNLEYFSNYSVIISTLGCGESGNSEFKCRTGITEPPVPSRPEDMVIKVTPISQTLINLQFNASLLNSAKGPVEAYGVLLSTDHQSNISSSSLTMTYSNWEQGKTKTYLTVLKLNENKKTRSNMITIVIGNNSDVLQNTAYNNGPLSNQDYRVALVLFTYLEIKDKLVDIQQSIFSLTPFAMNIAKPLDPSSNIVPIILGVLLPIVVLLIIVIIVLVIQKRRIKKEYTDIPVNNLRTKISIPVRVEDFEAYYKKQQLDSNCGFAEQYEDLKVVGTAQTKNSALAVENKGKNRYNNVLPYDSSRVKLSIHGSPFDDYINANYISGYNSKKEYIAAQGPLPATVNEFWRMIWEKHVYTIVMLTKCYEQGRVKCEKYWPLETKLYSNILVTTASEIELEDWTIRDFTIKNVKTAETRNVRQFHFTAWPDHGVPETTEVLNNFRHLVREHMDCFSRNAPAMVHCSAGVGRTGTFIALDHLIFQIERESMVDIFGIIYDMRMHRPLMVQTEDQYVFLNQCASDMIKSRMGTNVDLIYQNAAAFSIYENVQ